MTIARPAEKLASRTAARLERDIIKLGWPVGDIIGSESDLLDRYEVSRGVLREAVRILEHKQVARMRRGPGGGLVVTEPHLGPVLDAIAIYFRFAGVRLEELFEARRIVEGAATRLAAETLGEGDIERLREEYDDDAETESPHELHRHLAELSGSSVMEVFVGVLTRITALYVGSLDDSARTQRRQARESHAAHQAIVDALVRGNPGLAAHRMESHLDALGQFLVRRKASQTISAEMLGATSDRTPAKLAEKLARSVYGDVAERGWPVGEVLGSESDLIERHDVSRSVLREAARLLEYHQVATMRRGPGGGLIIAEPGIDAVAEAVTTLLEFRGVTPGDLYELRSAVEVGIVELAADRVDADAAAALQAGLEAESADEGANLNEVGHDIHLDLADVAANRVLRLFLVVLVRLSARHTSAAGLTAPRDEIAAEVHRTHAAIVRAVIDGDATLARHRMQKHLAALASHFV